MRAVFAPLMLVLVLCAAPAAASVPQGFHRLPLDEALSQNSIAAMVQDERGLIWFATLGGVDVYDGYRFRSISSDPRDPNSLAGVAVSALLRDHDGRIWAAGTGGWLDRIDPGSGRITHVSDRIAGPSDRPGSNAVALFEDRAGTLWIGSNTGLHRVSGEREIEFNADRAVSAAPLAAVSAIADADDGRLWLGTPDGVVLFDPVAGVLERHRHDPADPQSLVADRVSALLVAADGALWVGTTSGLSRRAPGAGGFSRFRADPADPRALGGDHVRALMQDRAGRLWVATQSGGLSLFDGDAGFDTRRYDANAPSSLSSNDVWSLFQDRSGLIWIGTAGGGLNQINPSTDRFQALRSLPFNPRSLRSPFVWDLAEDAAGRIWMTTLAGIERHDPRDGSFALFQPQAGDVAMNQLQSLHLDAQQRFWVGAVNGRLYRFDPERGRFDGVARDGVPDGRFSRDRVWLLGGEPSGRLWVGASEGLFALDPDSGRIVESIADRADIPMGTQPVRTMLADSDGVLWFGGGGAGLIRYQHGRGVTMVLGRDPADPASLSDNNVRALYESPDGALWVGTHNGLNRLAAEDRRAGRNRFKLYTRSDGLPDNTIYGIVPEGDGRHLWLSSNAGLSRFDPLRDEFRNFNVHDGLTANEMNGGAELRAVDGRLYFGSVGGVTWFRPDDLPVNTHVPSVAITEVATHRSAAQVSGRNGEQALELPHDAAMLTVRFAVTDFHQPNKNRFRYRLLGPDGGDWIDTAEPSITIARLPPAGYRLEVHGANNDGVWSAEPATLDVVVQPPWWNTPVAYAGEGLLILLAGLGYHRAQRRKLVREREFNDQLSRAHSLAEARHEMAMRYARYDQLTQLPNRSALIDALGRYLRSARLNAQPLALLLINLDRFQRINDSIGHTLGDRVLQMTAERLQVGIGSGDFLARVGSDEFALIALPPDAADDDWPEQLASRLQQSIAEPHPLRDPPLVIGAGIGIVCADDSAGPAELLGQADIAMHAGKRQAPGSIVRYRPDMRDSARERLSIEARMRRALDAGEFVAHYQPLVRVAGSRVSGFEALIRWMPADGPPIYPDQFIPVAEESGLIVELGSFMLHEVCRQLAEWRSVGVQRIAVAVNVSMRQLRSGTLVPTLRAALTEFGVPASMLKLEITESAMMENVEDTAEQLAAVRRLGVPVSVDDFGTGFSSLGHLKRLPVNELKIDRTFVSDVASSSHSRKIVASIVRLAHELDLTTVGEGVEDAECLACLREIGCDFAQGYHFARPMSAADVYRKGWLPLLQKRRA